MSWIRTIPPNSAEGRLRMLYDRLRAPGGQVDNILQAHSLRPHTLEGHLALYKNVLHHSANRLPEWLLETIGVWVSHLNGCTYCVDHHFAGLRRLLGDEQRAAEIRHALDSENLDAFPARERAILSYSRQLTQAPAEIREEALDAMRLAGLDDGEILEVNQVASYFAYANRTVLGLGVATDGEALGLAPSTSADGEDWRHG